MSGSGGNLLSSVGTGVGGALSDLTGQTSVAQLQGQAAQAQLGQQQSDRTQAMGMAAPTDSELQQLQQAYAVNTQNITQAQNLINSADPALVSAANQAVQLMNGNQQASSLSAINNSRATQRAALQSQLQQQLGSGYATSSAGIQALNNFDQQTSNLLNTAQQSAIGTYLNAANSGAQLGANQQQQGINNSLNINKTGQSQQQLQLGALYGTPVNPGLQYSGSLAQAGYNSGNANQLYQEGYNIIGGIFGGGKSNNANAAGTADSEAGSAYGMNGDYGGLAGGAGDSESSGGGSGMLGSLMAFA